MASFSATVDKWATQTNERLLAVRRRSVEILAAEMSKTRPQGGQVPFLVGNLARSLLASTDGMPTVKDGPFSGVDIGAVTNVLALKQTVWLGYQATYAQRVNYGFIGADSLGRVYNQEGAHFVEHAAARWEQTVQQAVNELRSQVS